MSTAIDIQCLAQTTAPVVCLVDEYDGPGKVVSRRRIVDYEAVRCTRPQGHPGQHSAPHDGGEFRWGE